AHIAISYDFKDIWMENMYREYYIYYPFYLIYFKKVVKGYWRENLSYILEGIVRGFHSLDLSHLAPKLALGIRWNRLTELGIFFL
ncbi:hypothetical protein ACJX0J_029665, partial [Zea mays]